MDWSDPLDISGHESGTLVTAGTEVIVLKSG